MNKRKPLCEAPQLITYITYINRYTENVLVFFCDKKSSTFSIYHIEWATGKYPIIDQVCGDVLAFEAADEFEHLEVIHTQQFHLSVLIDGCHSLVPVDLKLYKRPKKVRMKSVPGFFNAYRFTLRFRLSHSTALAKMTSARLFHYSGAG